MITVSILTRLIEKSSYKAIIEDDFSKLTMVSFHDEKLEYDKRVELSITLEENIVEVRLEKEDLEVLSFFIKRHLKDCKSL